MEIVTAAASYAAGAGVLAVLVGVYAVLLRWEQAGGTGGTSTKAERADG